MVRVVNYIEYYLPVFIPIFLSVISVLAGIVTKRIALSFTSLLKIHSDIVLGLFSFVIWALVAYQQTGAIRLNADYQLTFVRIVLLLFANIILLIVGQILLNVQWSEFPLTKWAPLAKEGRMENWAHGVFLAVTLWAVYAPIQLRAPRLADSTPGVAAYEVLVPYSDESLANHIGPARWGGRTLCDVSTQSAGDPSSALTHALAVFRDSGRAMPMFDRGAVQILDGKAQVRKVQ